MFQFYDPYIWATYSVYFYALFWFLVGIFIAIFVIRDARSRGMEGTAILWGVGVFFFFPFLGIYILFVLFTGKGRKVTDEYNAKKER